ncbi:chitin deacetylase [Marasmius crinis-equi]|uniref:chitin deacetylase n=1 Tax=Marasmius crinis-equi TaxID=585013 RepID=A0ABR3FMD0_9AGAR
MRFSSSRAPALLSLAAVVAVVEAGNVNVEHRQASSQSPASSGTTSSAASAPSSVRTGAAASLTFSLASQNPTAIPISSITATMSTVPTIPLASTPPAGATPSVSGAPGLPDAASIDPRKYPALDLKPPIDSPEVQAWKQEVANSGITIPNITATVAGGCPANPQAVADTGRCWWTCGGCTRETDISDCPNKNTWGLTFDDGPGFYTPNLLEYLDSTQLHATFFVVGSRCVSNPHALQLEYMRGHQISVHTWSHPSLTTLTNDEIIAELGWSRKVIKDILGVTPNTMRPPFGDIDDRVRAIARAMNLTPVMWTRLGPLATFDTDDFNVHNGMTTTPQVLNNWNAILGNASTMNTGFIVLQHDLFQETVDIATGYILPDAIKKGLNIQPVVSCLNKPMIDSYVETNDNKTNPPPISATNVATLSSGAPGSAQATGATGKNGAMQNAPLSASTALVGSALAVLFTMWL